MLAVFKGKLWLTYCAWFRQPLDQKIKKDFAAQLPRPSACLNPGLHHFLLGLRVCLENLKKQNKQS
jgi:hypothetical protein